MGVAEGGEGVVPEGFPDEVAPTPRQVLAASQRALVIDGLYDVDLPQSLGRTTARTRRETARRRPCLHSSLEADEEDVACAQRGLIS